MKESYSPQVEVTNEKTLELSNKLKNKLAETLKPLCNQIEIRNILDSVRLDNYDIYEQSEINRFLPEIFAAFFAKKNGLNDIEIRDLREMTKILSQKIVNKESFDDIVLSIGMGGSINIPNVRIPAYIVSAIKTLNSFKTLSEDGKIKGMPKVKVFKANHLSSELNQFDLEKVETITEITFDFIKAFIKRFFPHLENQFEFSIDQPITNKLIEGLRSQSELLLNIDSIKDEIANVLKMGEKHGGDSGKNNALLYATAHPFYNQSIRTQDQESPKIIMDYGGKPQAKFNKISRELIDANKGMEEHKTTPVPVVYLITKAGKIPVYYTARNGDLPLSKDFESINLKDLDRGTHIDYKEIFSLVDKQDFEKFTKNFINQHLEKIETLK